MLVVVIVSLKKSMTEVLSTESLPSFVRTRPVLIFTTLQSTQEWVEQTSNGSSIVLELEELHAIGPESGEQERDVYTKDVIGMDAL